MVFSRRSPEAFRFACLTWHVFSEIESMCSPNGRAAHYAAMGVRDGMLPHIHRSFHGYQRRRAEYHLGPQRAQICSLINISLYIIRDDFACSRQLSCYLHYILPSRTCRWWYDYCCWFAFQCHQICHEREPDSFCLSLFWWSNKASARRPASTHIYVHFVNGRVFTRWRHGHRATFKHYGCLLACWAVTPEEYYLFASLLICWDIYVHDICGRPPATSLGHTARVITISRCRGRTTVWCFLPSARKYSRWLPQWTGAASLLPEKGTRHSESIFDIRDAATASDAAYFHWEMADERRYALWAADARATLTRRKILPATRSANLRERWQYERTAYCHGSHARVEPPMPASPPRQVFGTHARTGRRWMREETLISE